MDSVDLVDKKGWDIQTKKQNGDNLTQMLLLPAFASMGSGIQSSPSDSESDTLFISTSISLPNNSYNKDVPGV